MRASSLPMFALAAVMGCAAPRPAASATTGAEVPTIAPEAPPERSDGDTASTSAAPPDDLPAPAGRLECRSKDPFGDIVELYLDWSSDPASGTLRTLAPTGNVREKAVHAQRYQDLVIADDPGETDLVSHAVILRKVGGRAFIRLKDEANPLACD